MLLLLLSGSLFFSALGKTSLWDIDEPNNAQCAREMKARLDPIVPTFNGKLRPDKPALIYWCMWLSYKWFESESNERNTHFLGSLLGVGTTEFSARFFSPLFGMATVALVFLSGNVLFSLNVGFWAGLILISTLLFNVSVRIATPDAALIFFINLAIFSFILGYEKRRGIYFHLFYLAMGLAVLTKGPMGIILPLATVFIFLLLKWDFSILKEMKIIKGFLLFSLITLPWYLLVGFKTNGAFLEGFLLKHNIHRFLHPMEGHRGPIFFYLLVLPFAFFPWSGVLPYIFWAGHKRRINKKLTNAELFLWLWIGIFILFFSLAHTKLPTYINPIFPALAVLMAIYLEKAVPWAIKSLLHFNLFFALLWLFGGGAALSYFYPKLVWLAFLGFIPFFAWAAGIYFYRHKRFTLSIVTQFLGAYCFILSIVHLGMPAVDKYKITKPFALRIKQEARPDILVIAYGYFQPSLVFYTEHHIEKLHKEKEVLKRIKNVNLAFIVSRKKPLKTLQSHLPSLEIIQCRPGFYVRDTVCLARWEKAK